MAKWKGQKSISGMEDICPHGEGHRQSAEGPSDKGAATDLNTGQVQGRIFLLKAKTNRMLRADMDAPKTDDAL